MLPAFMRAAERASPRGPIVFVHIPKTAGTSFRQAALASFGEDAVVCDYGASSPATSACIREHLYEKQDLDALRAALESKRIVAGHFCATKYLPVLPNAPLVTFVRDTVSRVESEFSHYRSIHGYEQSLATFVRTPEFRSKQRFFTRPLEPWHFDFIGRSDRFKSEIARFNAQFRTNLVSRTENTRRGPSPEPIDPAMLVRIVSLNGPDIVFEYLVERCSESLDGPRPARPPAFGSFMRGAGGELRGFAFALESHDPVDVGLYVNGRLEHVVRADSPRLDLVVHHMRMRPDAGFAIPAELVATFRDKGSIELRVEGTGVVLTERMNSDFWL